MSLDASILKRLARELDSPRLVDDAKRLMDRVKKLAVAEGASKSLELSAMQVACHALQLPFAKDGLIVVGRMGVIPLRERAEQSAELLVNQLGAELDEKLVDAGTRSCWPTR
jgi:hypothetical protein